MRRLLSALDRHWFAPASLRDLALVRILAFGSQTLFFIVQPGPGFRPPWRQIELTSMAPAPFKPLTVLKALLLPFGGWGEVRPDADLIAAALVVAFAGGALATVGLFARVTMPAAALANTLLVAHWFSYGDFHHAEALMLIALNVLAIAPSADAWSLDAVRRRRAGREAPPDASVFARWPLRLMQWLLALTYLSAAGHKLAKGGLEWFNGHTMMHHLITAGLQRGRELAFVLAELPPWVHVVPSIFSVLFELTFVVAILVPRTAWLYVLAGTAFQLGVYVAMRIGFFQTILLYSVFAESLRRFPPPALRLPRRLGRRGGAAPAGESSVRAA